MSGVTCSSLCFDKNYYINIKICPYSDDLEEEKERHEGELGQTNEKVTLCDINFAITRLVDKKIFMLHFIKNAVFNQKRFIDIHGQQAVIRDLISFFN